MALVTCLVLNWNYTSQKFHCTECTSLFPPVSPKAVFWVSWLCQPHLSCHQCPQTPPWQSGPCWRCWGRCRTRRRWAGAAGWGHRLPVQSRCQSGTGGSLGQWGKPCAIQKGLQQQTKESSIISFLPYTECSVWVFVRLELKLAQQEWLDCLECEKFI